MGEFIITIGNPDPELEESIGYEIGAEQFLFENRIHTGITYFEMKFDDLVIYDMLESRYKIAAMQKPRGLKHI